MYFKSSLRNNPNSNKRFSSYYRLVESYRNMYGRVCHRTILNVGFLDDPEPEPEQLNKIQKELSNRVEGKTDLFEEHDNLVIDLTEQFWERIVREKRVDIVDKSQPKKLDLNLVKVDSIKHKEVREIGAEWLNLQALNQLGIGDFLTNLGWNEQKVKLTITQIIARAIYPASELKTTSWIKENSGICELTGYPINKITKDKLYTNALDLYEIKDDLENYLSKKTNELFEIDDKIVLFDLTNTYFEGEKRNSKLAQFGRSKEKRSDAKIVVLAIVVNPEGFLKYSSVFEGNTSDPKTLPTIIDNLRVKTSQNKQRATVVLDAGIATEENLQLIEEKGYDYVCVSRSKLKDYTIFEGGEVQKVTTNNKDELSLQRVVNSKNTDYYLMVKSPGKVKKESGMNAQFEERFEQELEKIRHGLTTKHGTKKADKVERRIGRAIEKYPSVARFYKIETQIDEDKNSSTITWTKNEKHEQNQEQFGVYFIRTNLKIEQEQTLWKIYNTIREIEYSFRTLKTDLDLRPIYHKSDKSTLAHLHLGLLAYWLVNTIRFQLKKEGINNNWNELVRIANTQKIVTTTAQNQEDTTIIIKRCSEPIESLTKLYDALKYKHFPFTKRKSVVHKTEFKNQEVQYLLDISPH
jgi:hypothetical protein